MTIMKHNVFIEFVSYVILLLARLSGNFLKIVLNSKLTTDISKVIFVLKRMNLEDAFVKKSCNRTVFYIFQ